MQNCWKPFSWSPIHEYLQVLIWTNQVQGKTKWQIKIPRYVHLASLLQEWEGWTWLESLPMTATPGKSQSPPPANQAETLKKRQRKLGSVLMGRLPEPNHLLSNKALQFVLLCEIFEGLHWGTTYPISCHHLCLAPTLPLSPSRQSLKSQVAEETSLF